MAEQIAAKLKELDEHSISLVLSSPEKYTDLEKILLKEIIDEGKAGIYITLNKPASTIIGLLEQMNLDANKIFFIDLISQKPKNPEDRKKNVLYLNSPHALTELSIAISELVASMGDAEKYVIFDSISSLLIYHSPEQVAKFTHFLASKLRGWEVKTVLMILGDDASRKLIAQLSQFVDNVVDSTEGDLP